MACNCDYLLVFVWLLTVKIDKHLLLSSLLEGVLSRFSRARLFVTLWAVTRQAPPSVGSPGKNTGAGCHALLQGIFPTQGRNLTLSRFPLWKACPLPPASPRNIRSPNEATGEKEAQGLCGVSRDPRQGVHPLTEQPVHSSQFLSPWKALVPGLWM